jgi:hypothetical protein
MLLRQNSIPVAWCRTRKTSPNDPESKYRTTSNTAVLPSNWRVLNCCFGRIEDYRVEVYDSCLELSRVVDVVLDATDDRFFSLRVGRGGVAILGEGTCC